MSEYNINLNSTGASNGNQQKPKISFAILCGLGASVLVAIILAVIGMVFEVESTWVVAIGLGVVGVAIQQFVPTKSIAGAVIGAVLCPFTYFLYNMIMAFNGYYYEGNDNSWFWFLLVGSVVWGGYMGYNKEDD